MNSSATGERSVPLLNVTDLLVVRDENVLFKDLSFQVFRGERIGIFGPNGSGKTTLLKALLGQLKPKSGNISYCGTPIAEIRIAELGKFLGYLPQQYGTLPNLTVKEFFLSCQQQRFPHERTVPREVFQSFLEKVGLVGREDQHIPQLSGGELRRVFFGAAVMKSPSLLFLDEPLLSLDRAGRENMVKALQEHVLFGGEVAVVMVSHDEAFLAEFCSKIFQVRNCAFAETLPSNELTPSSVERSEKEWIQ